MREMKEKTLKKYWIIDLERCGMAEGTKTAIGPFKTLADAEKWLKTSAAESFESWNEYENLGPQLDWAAPVLIVEEKKKLQQVPVLNLKVKLEAVK